MFIIVRGVGTIMGSGVIITIIQGIVGVVTYVLVLTILKEKMNMMIINIVKNNIKR